MNRTTRIVLLDICTIAVIACAIALGVLRSGRPLFYTDGEDTYRADTLADRSMLVWDPPEVGFELPGPIEGRIARLPDGRVLYGRAVGDGTSDLVTFDPARPRLAPVAVAVLNASRAHDFAPAVTPDGRVFFSSDRRGGAGGFDLYRSEYLADGRFAVPVAVVGSCNTAADEVDPAPAPDAADGRLVFVRRGEDGGSSLLAVDMHDEKLEAIALFEDDGWDELDRDPVFAPDGTAVWFVRQARGFDGSRDPPMVMRTWSCVDDRQPLDGDPTRAIRARFEQPVLEASLGAFRSPMPIDDGFCVELLRDGSAGSDPIVYRAAAHEVYPWWEGQTSVERWLWVVLAIALVLIVLLLLGARWKQFDVVTWCILISGLLHLLVLWLVAGVELALDEVPGDGDGGRLEVRFVPAALAGDGGGGAVGRPSDVHAEIAFVGRSFEPDVAAPSDTSMGAAIESSRQPTVAVGQRAVEIAAAAAEVADRVAPAGDDREAGLQDAAAAVVASESTDVSLAGAEQRAQPARTISVAAAMVADGDRVRPPPTAWLEPVPIAAAAGAVALPRGAAARPRTVADGAARVAAPPESSSHALAAAKPRLQDAPVLAAPSADTAAEVGIAATVAQPSRSERSQTAPSSLVSPAAPTRLSPSLQAERIKPLAVAALALANARPRSTSSNSSRQEFARESASVPVVRSSPDASALIDHVRPADASGLESAATDVSLAAADFHPRTTTLLPVSSVAAARPSPRRRDPVLAAATIRLPGSFLAAARQRSSVARAAASMRHAKPADLYRNRSGPQKQAALEQFGGSAATELAVANGLRYLASVQRGGGYWGSVRKIDDKYGQTYVGKTALCLLAFLGAGHTHRSNSEYSTEVHRAVEFLLGEQHAQGHFGDTSSYGHGIATYALAECYAMTRDPVLRAPLEDAVGHILAMQQRGGGWGYFSETRKPEDGYARTSVSSWMVMALESARIGGFQVPTDAVTDATAFMRRMFDRRRGYVLYSKDPSRLRSNWRTLPASTPAATFCLLLLGADPSDGPIEDVLDYTVERRPRRYRRASTEAFVRRAEGNVYFWYYGSLACMLAGGDAWQAWNQALKEVLVPAQNADGSYSPVGAYARYAGDSSRDRSYTTAMIVLSLEVYYRYFTPLLARR